MTFALVKELIVPFLFRVYADRNGTVESREFEGHNTELG